MANETPVFEDGNYNSAFASARRALGAHKKWRWKRPGGAIQEFWTDYRTEIPVNQIVTREGYKIEDIKNNPELERRQREFDYDSAMRAAVRNSQYDKIKTGNLTANRFERLPGTSWVATTTDRSANPDYLSANGRQVEITMPEITVTGQRTNHKMRRNSQTGKLESAQEGFLPIDVSYKLADGNSVEYNYKTGMYEMIDRKGEVLAKSADSNVLQDPTLWTQYHTGYNGDIEQGKQSFERDLADEAAAESRLIEDRHTGTQPLKLLTDKDGNSVVDKNGKNVYVGQLTTDQVVNGMNYGKNIFVSSFVHPALGVGVGTARVGDGKQPSVIDKTNTDPSYIRVEETPDVPAALANIRVGQDTYDPSRIWETDQIVPPLSVEYEDEEVIPGHQEERMFGDPTKDNSIAAKDAAMPGNVQINGSNGSRNNGRSKGLRLIQRLKNRKSRRNIQETGRVDLSPGYTR